MAQQSIYDMMPRDPLAEIVQLVLRDLAEVDDLLEAVVKKEEEIKSLRQQFNATVSREPDQVQDYCREATQQVDKQFDEHFRILEELKSYGKDFDKSTLERELKKITEAALNLNLAFLRFRNDALIARGPSSHGGINLLINTLRRMSFGEELSGELQRDVFMEHNLAQAALQSLRTQEPGFFNEGLTACYINYLEVLKQFDTYFETGDQQLPASLEKALQAVGEQFSRVDINYLVKVFASSPTSLPAINMVINTGNRLVEGNGEAGVFQYFLEELWQLINTTRFRYEEIAKASENNTDIDDSAAEEADVIGESLDIISEALDGFETFLTNNDRNLFKESEEKLLGAAEMFAEAVNKLSAMAEGSNTITCFRCGFKNPRGNMTCSNCKTLLPQVEAEETSTIDTVVGDKGESLMGASGPQMTEHVSHLFDAAAAVVEGTLAPEEFEDIVNDMESRLKEAYKNVKEVPALTSDVIKELGEAKAKEMHNTVKEAAAGYKSGLDAFARGLKLFHEFSTNVATQTLEEAKDAVWQGVGQLQHAQKQLESLQG